MTLCPVALAVTCKKCPVFQVCPLKTVIGDAQPEAPKESGKPTARSRTSKKARRRAKRR